MAALAGLGAVRSRTPDYSKLIWEAKRQLYIVADRVKKAQDTFARGDMGAVIAYTAEAKAAFAVAEANYAPVRAMGGPYRSDMVEEAMARAVMALSRSSDTAQDAARAQAEAQQEEPEWGSARYGQAMPEEEPDLEPSWREPAYGPEDFSPDEGPPSRADLLLRGGRSGGYHGLAGGGRRRRRRRRSR